MAFSATFALWCVAAPAFALDSGDIVVSSLKGEVHVTMGGTERAIRAGAVILPPATVRTGADGAIELRQGATTVAVGPDTLLEFPALEKAGGPIDRVVQPRGSAFYNIGKREGRKLRIETPYLVGVVKGTQFNVLAQESATTISLFEGLLEVRSSTDEDVIDLHAGEIASRTRTDTDINVLKMSGDKAPRTPAAPRSPAPSSGTEGKGGSAPATSPARPAPAIAEGDESFAVRDIPVSRGNDGLDVAPIPAVVAPAIPEVGGDAIVDAGPAAAPPVDLPAAAGSPEPVIETVASVGTPVDIGAPDSSPPVDVGPPTDAGPPAEVIAAVNAPGLDVAASVGNGDGLEIAAGASSGVVALLPVETEVNLGVDVSAGAPTVDLGTSVNVADNTVDVGVSLGGDTLVGVDLGLDEDNSGPGNSNGNSGQGNNGNGQGNDNSGPGNNGQGNDSGTVVDQVTNLLDTLRGKSGRK